MHLAEWILICIFSRVEYFATTADTRSSAGASPDPSHALARLNDSISFDMPSGLSQNHTPASMAILAPLLIYAVEFIDTSPSERFSLRRC